MTLTGRRGLPFFNAGYNPACSEELGIVVSGECWRLSPGGLCRGSLETVKPPNFPTGSPYARKVDNDGIRSVVRRDSYRHKVFKVLIQFDPGDST